jgi:hypothetical protein
LSPFCLSELCSKSATCSKSHMAVLKVPTQTTFCAWACSSSFFVIHPDAS